VQTIAYPIIAARTLTLEARGLGGWLALVRPIATMTGLFAAAAIIGQRNPIATWPLWGLGVAATTAAALVLAYVLGLPADARRATAQRIRSRSAVGGERRMRVDLFRPAPAPAPPVAIHPIVVAAFCLCLASFPFEFPERTFRYEVPTMTTSLFLFTTLFQPRACYFNYIPGSISWLAAFLYTDALALALNGWRSFPDMAQEILLLIQGLLFFWACINVLRHDHIARAALWSFVIACIVRARCRSSVSAAPARPSGRVASASRHSARTRTGVRSSCPRR